MEQIVPPNAESDAEILDAVKLFEILVNSELRRALDDYARLMKRVYVWVRMVRAAEAKAVRTAYRRKRGKRW